MTIWLLSKAAQAYLQGVASQVNRYSGFNLLVGDQQSIWYLNSIARRPVRLTAGVYALCNGSLKIRRGLS